MRDDMVIIRPPSEAGSLLLPVSLGCSNNTCTFCGTYSGIPFRIRPLEDITSDIDGTARGYSFSVRRVFLENGDALMCPQPLLVVVLKHLNSSFPNLERTGTYATPRSALIKSPAELK
ncbi:MAG: radical SAM protein, partial [Chloroflexota bacterium]